MDDAITRFPARRETVEEVMQLPLAFEWQLSPGVQGASLRLSVPHGSPRSKALSELMDQKINADWKARQAPLRSWVDEAPYSAWTADLDADDRATLMKAVSIFSHLPRHRGPVIGDVIEFTGGASPFRARVASAIGLEVQVVTAGSLFYMLDGIVLHGGRGTISRPIPSPPMEAGWDTDRRAVWLPSLGREFVIPTPLWHCDAAPPAMF